MSGSPALSSTPVPTPGGRGSVTSSCLQAWAYAYIVGASQSHPLPSAHPPGLPALPTLSSVPTAAVALAVLAGGRQGFLRPCAPHTVPEGGKAALSGLELRSQGSLSSTHLLSMLGHLCSDRNSPLPSKYTDAGTAACRGREPAAGSGHPGQQSKRFLALSQRKMAHSSSQFSLPFPQRATWMV